MPHLFITLFLVLIIHFLIGYSINCIILHNLIKEENYRQELV